MQYKICSYPNLDGLQTKIDEAAKEGYELYGDLIIDRSEFKGSATGSHIGWNTMYIQYMKKDDASK